jgi:hypothetical protein
MVRQEPRSRFTGEFHSSDPRFSGCNAHLENGTKYDFFIRPAKDGGYYAAMRTGSEATGRLQAVTDSFPSYDEALAALKERVPEKTTAGDGRGTVVWHEPLSPLARKAVEAFDKARQARLEKPRDPNDPGQSVPSVETL